MDQIRGNWLWMLPFWCIFLSCLCTRFEVWEKSSFVLPCGGLGNCSDMGLYWCKVTYTDCEGILMTKPGTKYIFQPWKVAGVDLVNCTSLTIPSVSHSRDNGSFRCFEVSKAKSWNVFVSVLKPVKSVTLTWPGNPVSENTEMLFSCVANGGLPSPAFKWYLDDTENPTEIVFKQSGYTSNATVTAVRTVNNKIIKCEASIKNKSVFNETTIYIAYKRTVTIANSQTEHSEGDEFDLYCLVEANPPADATWSFKTKTVNNNVYRITSFDQSQAGLYTCSAKNREGGDTKSIVLKLKEDKGVLAKVLYGVCLVIALAVTVLLWRVVRNLRLRQETPSDSHVRRSPEPNKSMTRSRDLTGKYARIWFEKRELQIREVGPQREKTEYATIDFKATALLAQRIKDGKIKNLQEEDHGSQ